MTHCFTCKKKFFELKKCGNCLSILYCSKECQRNDWKRHKLECKEKKEEYCNRLICLESLCNECDQSWYTNKISPWNDH